jgi:hypothetical protein
MVFFSRLIEYWTTMRSPRNIIRSCFWKAKESGSSLTKEEQFLCDFKAPFTKEYLFIAQQQEKEAKSALDMIQQAKFIKATFYYLYFLALKTLESRYNKKSCQKYGGVLKVA